EVIDITAAAAHAQKKKGQAFVVYRDISCATNALRALQGFPFLDKPMRIAYARTKSDVVALEDGTYKPRVKGEPAKPEPKKAPQPAKPKGAPAPAKAAAQAKMMAHPGA
ncbi:unnamed protein product, partial [Prorocentrum cordatum]